MLDPPREIQLRPVVPGQRRQVIHRAAIEYRSENPPPQFGMPCGEEGVQTYLDPHVGDLVGGGGNEPLPVAVKLLTHPQANEGVDRHITQHVGHPAPGEGALYVRTRPSNQGPGQLPRRDRVGQVRKEGVATGEIAKIRPERPVVEGVYAARIVQRKRRGRLRAAPRIEGAIRQATETS